MFADDYNKISHEYETSWFNGEATTSQEIIKFLSPYAKGTVLDIGSGTGFLLDYIDIHSDHYLGIDPSEGMTKMLKLKHPNHKVLISTVKEQQIETFDLVVALHGSADYLTKEEILSAAKSPNCFLMFCRLTTIAICHSEKIREHIYNNVDWRFLLSTFLHVFTSKDGYVIATNIEGAIKCLS